LFQSSGPKAVSFFFFYKNPVRAQNRKTDRRSPFFLSRLAAEFWVYAAEHNNNNNNNRVVREDKVTEFSFFGPVKNNVAGRQLQVSVE